MRTHYKTHMIKDVCNGDGRRVYKAYLHGAEIPEFKVGTFATMDEAKAALDQVITMDALESRVSPKRRPERLAKVGAMRTHYKTHMIKDICNGDGRRVYKAYLHGAEIPEFKVGTFGTMDEARAALDQVETMDDLGSPVSPKRRPIPAQHRED